jgi:glycosyltransferase involved in cell wall biosynthesis
MVVVYYTSTHFLDVAIETIQSIKKAVELHIFIEITNDSKNTTIIDVDSLEGMHYIETPEKLLGKEKWEQLKGYFDAVESVHFIVHKNKRSLALKSQKIAFSLGRFLKKHKVDIVHFDTISPRAIGMYPFLIKRKVFITIHDPIPHSGETNWRESIPNNVFYPIASGFFFCSKFATDQWETFYRTGKGPSYTLKLQPYSFIRKLIKKDIDHKPGSILFFGRLSYYKGIDLLLEAIPKVLEKYPAQQFVIAGKPAYGYTVDEVIVNRYKENIRVIPRHLSMEELVAFIEDTKFIVCPYRDATQSGVVMTALAAGKMVVATNVGSFSEYIQDGENGLLADPDATAIANKILEALDNDKYQEIEKRLDPYFSETVGAENEKVILHAYKTALKNKVNNNGAVNI